MSSIGGLLTNPWTAAIAGAIVAGILGYKFAKGKNAYEAGSMEVARDLGGVSFSKNQMKEFYSSIGLSESQAYGVRKEVESSPKFLAEVIGPLAQQQGKMPQLLASLTSGYSAAYSAAFEKGMKTGDWKDLNKEYEIWESHFTALGKIMPDWKDKLAAVTKTEEENAAATAEAAAQFGSLADQFLQTGEMSDDFKKQITAAGGSFEAFDIASGAIKNLQGLKGEFADLKQAVDALLPPVKTWQQQFMETGIITDELAAKIQEAGGNIEDFKAFADVRKTQADWTKLKDQFDQTGEVSDELLSILRRFGDADTLSAFEALVKQAKESGVSIFDLAKESEAANKTIQDAFGLTGTAIDKQMTDAAGVLSSTLQTMDDNLTAAIDKLQKALVTMIKDLIDVLLEVPGAAEKAAADANFFLNGIKDKTVDVEVVLHTPSPEEIAQMNKTLSGRSGQQDGSRVTTRDVTNTGGETTVYTGERTNPPPRTRFAAGGYVDQPTDALLGEAGAEWVIPDKLLANFARALSGGSTRRDGRSGAQINQQITLVNPPDPWAVRKMMDRVNDSLVLALSQ